MKIKHSFKEARRIVRKHGFHSAQEFQNYECPGSYGVCKNVEEVYANEFRGWDDFLGVPPVFIEARQFMRLQGITSEEHYAIFLKSRRSQEDCISSRLPCMPDRYYKEEWCGWGDFLGF